MKKSQFYLLMIILVVICAFPTFGGLGNAAYLYDKFYWVTFVLNIGVYGYLIYLLNKMRKEAEVIERKEAEDKIKKMNEKLVANHPKVKTFKNK